MSTWVGFQGMLMICILIWLSGMNFLNFYTANFCVFGMKLSWKREDDSASCANFLGILKSSNTILLKTSSIYKYRITMLGTIFIWCHVNLFSFASDSWNYPKSSKKKDELVIDRLKTCLKKRIGWRGWGEYHDINFL